MYIIMKRIVTSLFLFLLTACLMTPAATAQQAASDVSTFKTQFSRHFQYAGRVLQLARAMPADLYDWRPMEGVMSVQEVYTHIAHYNFRYPAQSLDIPPPDGVDMDTIEGISGKEEVIAILEQSIRHLQEAVQQMPDSRLSASTELYGRTVNGQAVLMQLITHMSEHVGQSIAYARMNGVVPPWSR